MGQAAAAKVTQIAKNNGNGNAAAAPAAAAAAGAKKQTVFALKMNLADSKGNKLQLFCKQQKDGSFKVWAIHAKLGQKKLRGMQEVFKANEQDKAQAKYDEFVAFVTANGWTATLNSSKVGFTVLPVGE